VATSLRLVRDDEIPGEVVPSPRDQVLAMQNEIETLQQEVALLRRRDEMVHFYLHRMDEELRLAARLQQDFLPKEMPKVGSARFQALFRPAGYVSGDLYDVFRLDETHVGFYLADAIGHGVPAALLSMFLRTSLHSKEIFANGYHILSPGEALAGLNSALLTQNFSQTTFATAIYGVMDVKNCQVSLSSAGHPMPLLIPADGTSVREIACGGGALLGVFPDEVYPTITFHLEPRQRLILHSDGIESVFDDEMELGDCQPWQSELTRLRDMETADLLESFSKRLDRQSGSLEPKDDLTVIVLESL
jgi:sigma-B regulation protein RsbU (phosphoserine phosphatase)